MADETPDLDTPESLLIEALIRGDDDRRIALLLRWVWIRADADRQDPSGDHARIPAGEHISSDFG